MTLSASPSLTESAKQAEHAGRTKEKKKDGGAPGGSEDKLHPSTTTEMKTLPSKKSKTKKKGTTPSAGGPTLPKSPEATEGVGKTKERKKAESGRGSEDVPGSKQNKSKSIGGGAEDDGPTEKEKRDSPVSPGIRDVNASKDVEYSTDATVDEAPPASSSSTTIDIDKNGADDMTEEEEKFWLKRFFVCVGMVLLVIAVIIAFGILIGQLTAGRK